MEQLNILPQIRVVWGEDILSTAASMLSQWGIEKPAILSTRSLREVGHTSFWPQVADKVGVFTDLPAHAPEAAIRSGFAACVEMGARSIVAHGGGSVLDAAKAISFLHFETVGRHLPIAAFPTTLSGSEFSHYFGVTENSSEQQFKRSYAVWETVPKVVILDPALLLDTPRQLLLTSCIKAIDHAVEGMRAVTTDHPHAIMAANGVDRFFSVLTRWPKQSTTRDAIRGGELSMKDLKDLQLAAWHCYFAPASVIYGLSHRIGHVLGGTYGLPHSATSCITLAPVIRSTGASYGDKLSIFTPDASPKQWAALLADRISALVQTLNLPDRIGALELDRREIPAIMALLKKHYPKEVADLGTSQDEKLGRLLETLW